MDLSLAIIVKNEAGLLADLLIHHRDLFDEAVVVDTGSEDSSPEVAAGCGARVFAFPWQDDFAAARNHALEQVRGRWVLQLDCDERIDPEGISRLKNLIRDRADRCYSLRIHNYTRGRQGGEWEESGSRDHPWNHGAPGYLPTSPVRLFPRLPELRYRGIIHENLNLAIRQLGLPVTDAGVVIHHTGLLDIRGLRRRDRLYDPLLERKARQNPGDIDALTEWSRRLVARGEHAKAAGLLEKALDREEIQGESMYASLLLAEAQMKLGRTPEAWQRVIATVKRHPQHHICWVHAVAACLMDARLQEARLYLEQGRRLFPASPALRELAAKV